MLRLGGALLQGRVPATGIMRTLEQAATSNRKLLVLPFELRDTKT